MPLDQSCVGRTYPPTAPYEVGREKIREFAEAIGDPNPVYRDPEAAKALGHPDVIAPPTFPIVFALPSLDAVLADPDLPLDWSRRVHGDQKFAYTRPIHVGDRLISTVTIDSIMSRGGNDMVTTRIEVTTELGESVMTATAMLVVREDS